MGYQAILGQPGSKPIDLFWDMVEEEERALRSTRNDVLDVLDDKRFEIQTKTTFEEFLALMQNDRRTANIDRDALSLIFERLHEKVSRRNEADNVQLERQQRRAVDALRSFIKHLEPPIRIDDTFERIRPRIERSEKYVALPTDELRRSAFDKVIRRLKEKEEDAEKDRLKRRDRTSVDRPTHRDRDRGERSHRRRTRSPEPDAYEADRRKAIADREKNYRKASAADTLLSPGRRDRGDRERDRDRERERDRDFERDLDRPHRSHREEVSSHYDRVRVGDEELTVMWKVLMAQESQREPEEKLHPVSDPQSLHVNGVTGLGHHLLQYQRKRNQPFIPAVKRARSKRSEKRNLSSGS